MKKQIISFTVEPELEEYIKKMAEKDRTTVSQYIRNLLWSGYEIEQHINDEVKIGK